VGAIDQPYFGHDQLRRALSGSGDEPLLYCQWSGGRAGADDIPLPCAGRVDPGLLVRGISGGARSMTVATCEDDCRFRSGHEGSLSAVTRVRDLIGMVGLEPFRIAHAGERKAPVPSSPFIAQVAGRPPESATPHGTALADVEAILAHPEVTPEVHSARTGDVLLLTGCEPFADGLAAREMGRSLGGRAALDLLTGRGVEVALLADQRSCGARIESSDPGSASVVRSLLAESIRRSGCKVVVTTCALSARILEKHFPALGLSHVDVLHLSQYLDGFDPEGLDAIGSGERVAILDEPSAPPVRAATRRLLQAAGYRPVKFSFPRRREVLEHGGRSREGVVEILRAARDAGADTLVTTSAGLAMDLMYATRPGTWDGFGIRVSDLATLLSGGER
jgi:hypothetical protein